MNVRLTAKFYDVSSFTSFLRRESIDAEFVLQPVTLCDFADIGKNLSHDTLGYDHIPIRTFCKIVHILGDVII